MPTSSKLKQSTLTFASWEPLRQASSQRSSAALSSPRSAPRSPAPRSSPPRMSLPSSPPPYSARRRRSSQRSQPSAKSRRSSQYDDSSDEAESDDFFAVRLGPASQAKATQKRGRLLTDDENSPPVSPTRRRVVFSGDESEKSDFSIEIIGSTPGSPPSRNTRSSVKQPPPTRSTRSKGKQPAVPRRVASDSDSEVVIESDQLSDDDLPLRRPRRCRQSPSGSASPPRRLRRRGAAESSSPRSSHSPRKRRRSMAHPDPDDEASPSAATEDEDARAEIEMDEPERFTASTRLRGTKESAWAANLRRLKNSRNINAPQSVSSGSEGESEGDGEDDGEGDWAYEVEGELSDFIASDDSVMPVELPEEFSHKRESNEYKFKVVFQYLLLLAIKGPDILPLSKSNTEYFARPLSDVRYLMKGFRDSVASTLWTPKFKKAMEKYPVWKEAEFSEREEYCDGCNRRNQHCYQTAWLRGKPYNRETHEALPPESEDEDSEDGDSDEDERILGNMGNRCMKRAHDYHELHHWEHQMYMFIKSKYNDLMRAKGREVRESSLASESDMSDDERRELAQRRRASAGRVAALERRHLLYDFEDVDQITEFFDAEGIQLKSMEWLGRVEGRARRLEGHYRT